MSERKPTRLRILHGNPGHRSIPKPLRTAPRTPQAPRELSAEARAEWKRVVPDLDRQGVLTRGDRAALTGYVTAWSTMQAAQRVIDANGLTYVTDTGFIRPRPEVQIAREAREQLLRFAQQFGLTPLSRDRLSAPPPPDDAERLLD
jgi:P27 family predicted phage terminase small subunit